MESLFSATLKVSDTNAVYKVVFDKEKYIFIPEEKEKSLPTFSLRREHDEWLQEEMIAPQLKILAIDALENYLLAQH